MRFNLPITCFKVLGKVNVFLHLNETCNLDVTLNSNLTPFTNNAEERAIKACLKEFKLSVGAAPYQLMLDFTIDDIPKSPNLLSLKNARAVFHNLAILNVNNLTATEEAFIDSSIE